MKKFDNCRVFETENGNYLITVRSSDDTNIVGYLNYKSVKEELKALSASPEEEDAIGPRLFRAESFTIEFKSNVGTVEYKGKDFYDLESVKVKSFTI